MKILQVNKYHYVRGGAERVYLNTIDLLRSRGHEVLGWAARHPRNLPAEAGRFFPEYSEMAERSPAGKVAHMGQFFINRDANRRLEALLREWRPDVAHLHNIFNGLGPGILKVLRRHNVPVVMTMHDVRLLCSAYQAYDFDSRRCRACRRLAYTGGVANNCRGSLPVSVMCWLEMVHKEWLFDYDACIDRYIFLNRRFMEHFASIHPYFGRKGEILFNFVPDSSVRETGKGDYVLFQGRLSREKGLGTLLEAARRRPEVRVRIAGDGEERAAVERAALPNVELLGYLQGDALRREVEGCSFVVVPSEWMENNPMAVIEANAAGKPVIAAEIGGIPEIVVDGVTGFLFPSGDASALADLLGHVAAMSAEEYAQTARNALVFARENFAETPHYTALMDIYTRAIAAKHR